MKPDIMGTYDMSVCGDCIMWDAYGGSGPDGEPVPEDDTRAAVVDEMAAKIGADEMLFSYRDYETGETCRHEGECYCTESHFSWRNCDLCGQIAGSRWDVVITGFAPSKVGA